MHFSWYILHLSKVLLALKKKKKKEMSRPTHKALKSSGSLVSAPSKGIEREPSPGHGVWGKGSRWPVLHTPRGNKRDSCPLQSSSANWCLMCCPLYLLISPPPGASEIWAVHLCRSHQYDPCWKCLWGDFISDPPRWKSERYGRFPWCWRKL